MTGAEIATTADTGAILAELRNLRATVEELRMQMPIAWISLAEAKQRLGIRDDRTVVAAIDRGEIRGKKLGRKWLIDPSSLRHVSNDEVVRMAAEARR